MRNILGLLMCFLFVSCATGPGQRKGPSPYSHHWNGEAITSASIKECPSSKDYLKMSWKSLVTLATQCVRAQNFAQTERVAHHLARTEPESHWGAYFLSLSAEARKDFPRAMWMIELALKKAPEDGLLLYQRGRIHWRSNQYELALNDLEEAVSRNPSISEAYLLLGQVQFTKNDLGKAQASFNRVLQYDKDNPEAIFGLGEVAFKKQDYENSYSYHKRAIRLNPRLGVSYLRLAQIQEIHFKDFSASLSLYKNLQKNISLNRVDKIPSINLDEKMKSLHMLAQQSVAGSQDKKVSEREPSGKKVSK